MTDSSTAAPRPSIEPALEYTFRRRLHRVPGVLECEVADELLLYRPDGERAFSLNASARAIWELCRGTHSAPEMAEVLAERHGVRADLLMLDVCGVVRQLRDLGLVTAARPIDAEAATDDRRPGGATAPEPG